MLRDEGAGLGSVKDESIGTSVYERDRLSRRSNYFNALAVRSLAK
jgi:hypothetical protein